MSLLSKKSSIIVSLFVLLLLGTNIFTYKVATEKTNFDMFLLDIGYDFSLLKGLDENKIQTIKSLLVGGIGRIFYAAGKDDDLNKFIPVCKYFTDENIQRYKKYDNYYDEKYKNYINQESKELNKIVKLGEEKLISFCRKNK